VRDNATLNDNLERSASTDGGTVVEIATGTPAFDVDRDTRDLMRTSAIASALERSSVRVRCARASRSPRSAHDRASFESLSRDARDELSSRPPACRSASP
jgi:hypothetical protein